MAVVERVVNDDMSEVFDVGIVEVFFLGHVEHLLSFSSIEELALAVEQLQGIPLARIVGGSNDDAAVGTTHADSQLSGGCRGIADVDDIEAHTYQRATDDIAHHRARDTAVATDDNLGFLLLAVSF